MSAACPHDHVPFVCPRGHPIVPGETIVSWSPCVCAPSVALGEGRQGHRTYLCLACKDERRTTLCYLPAHVPAS